MTKKTKILVTSGALAGIIGLALAGAVSHAGGDWKGHHGMRGGHAKEMFQRFDEDGDGQVTREEIDAVRGAKFVEYDGDADTTLTVEEFEGLWMEIARPRMVDHFQRLDEDGDGQITEAEYSVPFDHIVSRLDRNDDGAITKDELRKHKRHDHDDDYDHDDDDENDNDD